MTIYNTRQSITKKKSKPGEEEQSDARCTKLSQDLKPCILAHEYTNPVTYHGLIIQVVSLQFRVSWK